MTTVWTEMRHPDSVADGGWLKVLTDPYDQSMCYGEDRYTSETMPVWDEEVNGWREQSTLGNYLNYGQTRKIDGPGIHCVSYIAKTVKWVHTIEEARTWIESEAIRCRPELKVQTILAFA